ncbi:hypothetical protein LCI18_003743 [Fusarium solani-melongenae]|uniref:Uncharacterized protein n=1 Tax=Fusarium solani subsp. cucurbitae TaxID=2747967 RepID=A0ACD3YY66_FUSSC|nr:hypothetical protein LCI18_003743 [Fusarium solani-melongenae]
MSLNTDQPGDGESSEDDRDFGPRGGDEYTNYGGGGGDYGDDSTSLGGDEDGHRGQDHTEPINQMQPGADSGAQPQNQSQPVTENRLGVSFVLNPESSQARSPRQSLAPAPGGSIAFCETYSQPSHREAQDDMHWDQEHGGPANEMSSGPTALPCSARLSLEPQAPPSHGNSENDELFHGKSAKRQKTQGTSGVEPGRDVPSGEDQPPQQAQQVAGDIAQRRYHGADDASSALFFCNHYNCRIAHNKAERFTDLGHLYQHVWNHSKEKQREYTYPDETPEAYEEFERHLQKGKCQQLDLSRTPGCVKGMMVFGYIKDEAEFTFDSVNALQCLGHLDNQGPGSALILGGQDEAVRLDNPVPLGRQTLASQASPTSAASPGRGSTIHVSNEPLFTTQPERPMRLDIDPAGDGDEGGKDDDASSGDLISSEAAMMTESDSVQPAQPSMPPQAAENALTLDWRPQHHDQDQSRDLREKAALNLSDASETESGVHTLPAATSFRELLTPESTLEMGENISQCGAMPASDVRDADQPKDYEDGNLCEDLVSSETAVAPRSEEGEDGRTAKRQRTQHKQQASESVATEMGQDQGQGQGRQRQPSCGRSIHLDSPAITAPPEEASSIHSSLTAASGFPNVIQPQQPISLDADPPRDGGEISEDDRVSRPRGGDGGNNYNYGGGGGDYDENHDNDTTSLSGDKDTASGKRGGSTIYVSNRAPGSSTILDADLPNEDDEDDEYDEDNEDNEDDDEDDEDDDSYDLLPKLNGEIPVRGAHQQPGIAREIQRRRQKKRRREQQPSYRRSIHLDSPAIPGESLSVYYSPTTAGFSNAIQPRQPGGNGGNDNGGNDGYNSPASTLQMARDITHGRAMPVSDHGAPNSSPMAIQPQQPIGLDADPAEYGDYDNNPVPILHCEHPSRGAQQQPGLKRKRQPQRHEQTCKRLRIRGRDAPKATATPEGEDSAQRQDPKDEPESRVLPESQAHHQPGECSSVRSSPTASSGFPNAIQQQQPISLNTDQPGVGESSEDDSDVSGYGDDDTSLSGNEDGQSGLHGEAGHGRHRDQDHAESANEIPLGAHPLPTVSPFHGLLTPGSTLVGEGISQCGAMLARDVRDADPDGNSNDSAHIRREHDQPRSEEGSPAVTTPPEESSPVHSSPTAASGFPNAAQQQPINLNTDQSGNGREGSIVSGETEMMAPAPTGGNKGSQDDDDGDYSDDDRVATDVGAKVTERIEAMNRRVRDKEELQRAAIKKQESIESEIEQEEEWAYKLEVRIKKLARAQVESFKEIQKMKAKRAYWQKEAEEAKEDAKKERQRLRQLARRLEKIIE